MLATLFQVLIALPKILAAAKELSQWLHTNFGENWPETIERLHNTTQRLNHSKSPEERVDAVRDLYKFLQKL